MPLHVTLNGQARSFSELTDPSSLAEFISGLGLRGDRVAVELNGAIVARERWLETPVAAQDKLEVVHFVGGGAPVQELALRSPSA